jgi:hypothetical protein
MKKLLTLTPSSKVKEKRHAQLLTKGASSDVDIEQVKSKLKEIRANSALAVDSLVKIWALVLYSTECFTPRMVKRPQP